MTRTERIMRVATVMDKVMPKDGYNPGFWGIYDVLEACNSPREELEMLLEAIEKHDRSRPWESIC